MLPFFVMVVITMVVDKTDFLQILPFPIQKTSDRFRETLDPSTITHLLIPFQASTY